MNSNEVCPISRDTVPARYWDDRDAYTYECPRCGQFAMSWRTKQIVQDLPNPIRRKVTALLRERMIREEKWPIVNYQRFIDPNRPVLVWNELVEAFPDALNDRLKRTLLNLVALSKRSHYGAPIVVDGYFEPVAFAKNYEEMTFIFDQLVKDELITRNDQKKNHLIVTKKGWDYVANLAQEQDETVPDQKFFSEGKPLDVQKCISKIIRQAKQSLWICDAYMDEKIIEEISEVSATEIKLLTNKPKGLFYQRLDALRKQCPEKTIEAKSCEILHDRFYVIDEEQIWSLGTSYNKAGDKPTFLSKVIVDMEIEKLKKSFQGWWKNGKEL